MSDPAQDSPSSPLTPETPETPGATDPTLLAPEIPVEPQPAPAPEAANPRRDGARMRMVGIAMAVLGTGLVAAPHVSTAAARALAPLAVPELVGGIWIAGGLLLFVGGLLRRSLAGIRHSLETVGAETARVAELARETHVLGSSVDLVQQANQELKLGVVGVQKQIERLTEIASDPNNSVSMFRLAASVDQLGARLDIFIKDQFRSMRQQLTEVVERTNQTAVEFGTRISGLGEQLSEEHVSQQLAFTEQSARTYAGIERIVAGSDANIEISLRLEAQVAADHQTQSNALESLGADWLQGSDALNTGIREVGGRIDRRLVEQAGSLDGRLKQIDGALESISGDWLQGSEALQNGLRELGGRVDGRLGKIDGALESLSLESLQNAETLSSGLQELGGRIERRIDEKTGSVDGHLGKLDGALESLGLESLQNAETLHSGLQELGGRIERRIEEQTSSVDARIGKLDGALERSGKERDDLARDLAARLERDLAVQSTGVQQGLDAVAEVDRRVEQVGGELNSMLAELGSITSGQHEALQAALDQGIERVHAVSTQTGVAAEESLKAAARLESSLHDARASSNLTLASIHEAWSQEAADRGSQVVELAARLEHELAEHSKRLEQLADALTKLADASSRSGERQDEVSRLLASPRELSSGTPEPQELEREWGPSAEQQELLEAQVTLDQAPKLQLEPPPALPTSSSVESRSDLTP